MLIDWTRHRWRLNRNFGPVQIGNEAHARQAMVAEFGAAFLCAVLGVAPEPAKRHAANIARFLRAIKTDRRAALSQAIKHAETAAEYLYSLQRR
jgi:antirestriction protein ArdC